MANARDRGSTQPFGPFVFDRASEELSQARRRIPLQPQPARLLGLFLSRPGELLTREAIREHLWPENFVEFEQRISSLVRTLRITLGDDRADPRYIQTVSRKGYRFIGLEGQSTPWFRRDFRKPKIVMALYDAFVNDTPLSDVHGVTVGVGAEAECKERRLLDRRPALSASRSGVSSVRACLPISICEQEEGQLLKH